MHEHWENYKGMLLMVMRWSVFKKKINLNENRNIKDNHTRPLRLQLMTIACRVRYQLSYINGCPAHYATSFKLVLWPIFSNSKEANPNANQEFHVLSRTSGKQKGEPSTHTIYKCLHCARLAHFLHFAARWWHAITIFVTRTDRGNIQHCIQPRTNDWIRD